MKTWILIANAARARLFEAEAADGGLVELAGFAQPESRMHGIDLTHDRPGRVQESATSSRHGVEPKLHPHEKAALEFAHGLAEVLEHGRVEHDFDRLVLVAPPRFLGQLRGALHEQVSRLVVNSIDKDASGDSLDEIETLLQL